MRFTDLPERPRADVFHIIDYYITEAGDEVALTFIDALERALRHLADHPESGSLWLGSSLGIKGLRVWPIKGFPHIVVYQTFKENVAAVRILHTARDIPATLQEE